MAEDDDQKSKDIATAKEEGIEAGKKGDDSSSFFDSSEESAARAEGNALGQIAHNSSDDDD